MIRPPSSVRSARAVYKVIGVIIVTIIVFFLAFPFVGLSLLGLPDEHTDGRRLEAQNTCTLITVALNAYLTDYGGFPPLSSRSAADPLRVGNTTDAIVGDPGMGLQQQNSVIFYTLRAIPKAANENHAANTRKIVFLDAKKAVLSIARRPFHGFFDEEPNARNASSGGRDGCLYDPWGHQYGIVMDTNGDERIDLAGIYTDFTGANPQSGKAPHRRAGAFSMGKDGVLGIKGTRVFRRGSEVCDDLVSWE